MDRTNGSSLVFGAACAVALGLCACGGGAEAAHAPIASLPASPADAGKAAEPVATPESPKDPKQICAGAPDLVVSLPVASDAKEGRVRADLDGARDDDSAEHAHKAKGATFSMRDLQALEKRQAWEELLEHAEDVSPAQRGADWNKLIEKAATSYLQSLGAKSESFERIFASQQLLKRYPHLASSSDFMAKRADAGKAASEACLRGSSGGQHCIDMMKDFLKASNTAADVGFAFGKIVRKNQNHYVAVPFFKWAFDQKPEAGSVAAMCGDSDLKLATMAGLGLPPDNEAASGARHIAASACWDGLRADLRKHLIEHQTGYFRDNACAVLKSKGDL